MSSVFSSTSNVPAHAAYSSPSGSLLKLSGDVWMTCSCASYRLVWITRLPCASRLSKMTALPSAGGAMVTALRRKSRILDPKRRSASSAASSARWRSCRRFAASVLKRVRTVASSVGAGASGLAGSRGVSEAWPPVRERERVRLMMVSRRSVKPRVASPPTAVSSFWAVP